MKKRASGESCEAKKSDLLLSQSEQDVLDVFRKYLMTPGKMLCISNADLDSFKTPLAELINKGLLVEEKFQGGYSLTETGFDAMNSGSSA